MIKNFIALQIKKAARSSIWQKNLALNIFIGFILFMLTAEFVLLGYFLDEILLSIDPEGAPELMLESIFLYYFLLTFLSRFFMQNLPTAEIGQFLHLPIKRSKIAM